MPRLTTASPLRIALLLLLGLFALDYVWVQTHPGGSRMWPNRHSGMRSGGNACPDPSSMNAAQQDERATLGEREYGWKLRSLDGREATFGEYRGKVVFVNVWATWCGPCVAEMPGIQALYDAVEQEGAAFVLVSEEKEGTVKSFVEQARYSFPVFTTGQIPEVFETRGIPATFIVNRQGAIVYKHLGSADWNTDSCRKLLRALL
ncbi:MAG: TlpA family protein disulfide reductase [Acidobacteria bacterium]|nr:TlpA family protein disulfide reductase [Acidobacteriota bacterium]MBI3663072.1 TlpA family protein disulfide reductase [Acidobacteriota bacterium]